MKTDKNKDYWDKRIRRGGLKSSGVTKVILHEYSNDLKWKLFWRHFAKYFRQKKEVLDVGCGYGFWCEKLGKKGHRMTGTDITEEAIKNAKIYTEKVKKNITFKAVRTERITYKEQFDMAISIDSLQHITDDDNWRKAISNVYRALKPGGYFILYESAHLRKKQSKIAWKAERTFKEHRQTLEAQGFTWVKSYPLVWNGYYAYWILEKLVSKKLQRMILRTIFFPIDSILARINCLKYVYYPKIMIVRK